MATHHKRLFLLCGTTALALSLTALPLDPLRLADGFDGRRAQAEESSCFVGGTLVLMADGTQRPIETLEVGDLVLGRRGRVNRVIGVERTRLGRRRLYALNDGRPFVTAEHPFLTAEGWKALDPEATRRESPRLEVAALSLGDRLCRAVARRLGQAGAGEGTSRVLLVQSCAPLRAVAAREADPDLPLYNLLLDQDHSYVADGWLVHNKGEDSGSASDSGSSSEAGDSDASSGDSEAGDSSGSSSGGDAGNDSGSDSGNSSSDGGSSDGGSDNGSGDGGSDSDSSGSDSGGGSGDSGSDSQGDSGDDSSSEDSGDGSSSGSSSGGDDGGGSAGSDDGDPGDGSASGGSSGSSNDGAADGSDSAGGEDVSDGGSVSTAVGAASTRAREDGDRGSRRSAPGDEQADAARARRERIDEVEAARPAREERAARRQEKSVSAVDPEAVTSRRAQRPEAPKPNGIERALDTLLGSLGLRDHSQDHGDLQPSGPPLSRDEERDLISRGWKTGE